MLRGRCARCARGAASGRVRRVRGVGPGGVRARAARRCEPVARSRDVGGPAGVGRARVRGGRALGDARAQGAARVDAARALAPALAGAVHGGRGGRGRGDGVELVAVPGTRAAYRRRGYDPVRLLISRARARGRAGCSRQRVRTASQKQLGGRRTGSQPARRLPVAALGGRPPHPAHRRCRDDGRHAARGRAGAARGRRRGGRGRRRGVDRAPERTLGACTVTDP